MKLSAPYVHGLLGAVGFWQQGWSPFLGFSAGMFTGAVGFSLITLAIAARTVAAKEAR
jgi:hypothetical protein